MAYYNITKGGKMGTINVRVDDHVQEALRELAAAEGMSLSEYIRVLLRDAVVRVGIAPEERHGDERGPDTLQFMDRKVLSLLHRILGRVLPDGANDVDGDRDYQLERARILEKGFTGEYSDEAAGFATELSKRDSRRVVDILEMFHVIAYSVERHATEGAAIDSSITSHLTYQGFDFNDSLEGQMARYVEHLISTDRWVELKPAVAQSDGGNSHMPMLDTYSRMLAQYRRIMDTRERRYARDNYFLSAEELETITDAQVHPSNR